MIQYWTSVPPTYLLVQWGGGRCVLKGVVLSAGSLLCIGGEGLSVCWRGMVVLVQIYLSAPVENGFTLLACSENEQQEVRRWQACGQTAPWCFFDKSGFCSFRACVPCCRSFTGRSVWFLCIIPQEQHGPAGVYLSLLHGIVVWHILYYCMVMSCLIVVSQIFVENQH